MLENEYEYFNSHREDFIKKYKNKFVVIKGQQVLGIYKSMEEAINETKKEHDLGTFLVQQCIPEGKNIQHFHTRVVFN